MSVLLDSYLFFLRFSGDDDPDMAERKSNAFILGVLAACRHPEWAMAASREIAAAHATETDSVPDLIVSACPVEVTQ